MEKIWKYWKKYFAKKLQCLICKKKVFLEISQNSQENTGARVSFLIKLQASGLEMK